MQFCCKHRIGRANFILVIKTGLTRLLSFLGITLEVIDEFL